MSKRQQDARERLMLTSLPRALAQLWIAAVTADTIGREVSVFGAYESEQLLAMRDLIVAQMLGVAAGFSALDVGANIGNHAIHLAQYFGQVIAFESNPSAARILLANLELHAINNVMLHECGLSDEEREPEFREKLAQSLWQPLCDEAVY